MKKEEYAGRGRDIQQEEQEGLEAAAAKLKMQPQD